MSIHDLSDQLLDFCERTVKESDSANIDSFHYYGDLDHGTTWGRTFSVNRDSDLIERVNWEEITQDLEERYPDDTMIERSNHWACGWVDTLAVRMLNADGSPTEAAEAVMEWHSALEEYPVANDERLSEMEFDEAYEAIEWSFSNLLVDWVPDDTWVGTLMDWLLAHDAHYESDSGGTYWTAYDWSKRKEGIEDLAKKGLFELGLLDEDYAYELWAQMYYTYERGTV